MGQLDSKVVVLMVVVVAAVVVMPVIVVGGGDGGGMVEAMAARSGSNGCGRRSNTSISREQDMSVTLLRV